MSNCVVLNLALDSNGKTSFDFTSVYLNDYVPFFRTMLIDNGSAATNYPLTVICRQTNQMLVVLPGFKSLLPLLLPSPPYLDFYSQQAAAALSANPFDLYLMRDPMPAVVWDSGT